MLIVCERDKAQELLFWNRAISGVLKLHGQNFYTPFLECLVSHAEHKRGLKDHQCQREDEEEAEIHSEAL